MKNILTFGLATTVLLICSTQAQAASFVIDDFSSDGVNLINNDTQFTDQDTVAASGVPGGARDVSLTSDITDPLPSGSFVLGSTVLNIDDTNSNQYQHSNGINIVDVTVNPPESSEPGSEASITYSPSALDLTAGFNTFQLDIIAITGSNEIGLTVSDSGSSVEIEKLVSTTGNVSFSFSDFAGIDFSNIQDITLKTTLTGSSNATITLDNFVATSTPEPVAILGLVASVGFSVLSKKKKQA